MPRVKIDYVVSFSSEDPEHPASNLLAGEVSKKHWLCTPGEPACSVVLQLARAVQVLPLHDIATIVSVNIGAYNTAFIEILVGRSESPNEQYQVLVARSVLQAPGEARRAAGEARVRSYGGPQLARPAAAQRWDRLRLVCSQPYNRRCQYGLSFVHVFEPAGVPASAPPAPAAPRVSLDALAAASSDDEEFRPGELFARHRPNTSAGDAPPPAPNAESQIRRATSQALKNMCESSSKLKKTPIAKPSTAEPRALGGLARGAEDEDERPRPRIHLARDERDRRTRIDDTDGQAKKRGQHGDRREEASGATEKRRRGEECTASGTREREAEEGDGSEALLLRGVVFALSGYANPRRAGLRALGQRLGAVCLPAPAPALTHLICAFPNTPKMRAAGSARAVTGEWLEAVAAQRRRVPWRRYATDPRQRRASPSPTRASPSPTRASPSPTRASPSPTRASPSPTRASPPPTDGDTDDEIEEVIRKQKKRGVAASDPAGSDSDATVADEQVLAERDSEAAEAALPSFFSGLTFALPAGAPRLERYVRAYGGLALRGDEAAEGRAGRVDYWVGRAVPPGAGGRRVAPSWLARCHAAGGLCE